ncbi:MAG TPA: SDR family oxidoreductase [Tepidisphaeraceae bacterium]|nr:SDR family oxidoreductase [Tepidisphaeraceae bacterium]
MRDRLKDRIAIVTGAAQGIGRAISERLAEEGAWVLATDLNGEGAFNIAEEIRNNGGRADSYTIDIANPEHIELAVRKVTDEFGRVDILCNNAAYISEWHEVLHATDEEWNGCLNATILGTQNLTRAVLPWMIPQKRGSIIITGSIMGMVGFPNAISYSTVKAGLIGFTRSAACDYGKHNIRVNMIAPGAIRVHYSPEPGDPWHEWQTSRTFLGRQGEPSEIANTAAFLASDEASYITGAIIPVDGGWTAM